MQTDQDILIEYAEELKRSSPAVFQAFMAAGVTMQQILSKEDFRRWVFEGVEIARGPFRSWEAAAEYFKASPAAMHMLTLPQLLRWGLHGRDLAGSSADIAAAYFRVSPMALPHLASYQVVLWAGLGESIYRGEWQSGALAVHFFESTPRLLHNMSFDESEKLVAMVNALVDDAAYKLARECLDSALESVPKLEKNIRKHVLELMSVLMVRSKSAPFTILEHAPSALARIEREEQVRFVSLAVKMARLSPTDAVAFFAEGSQVLGKIDRSAQPRVLTLAEDLLQFSSQAALAFVKSSSSLLIKVRPADLDTWCNQAKALLREREEAGISFLKLESTQAEEYLTDLSRGIELQQIAEILQLYAKALTGTNLQVLPLENLNKKGIGWTSERMPTTEGTNLFLPSYIQRYQNKQENFACYKVYTTHQAAHLEFGSFAFQFQRQGLVFPALRLELDQHLSPEGSSLTDMERFLDLFPSRVMAADIFTIAEDARIDATTKREYPGIRPWVTKVQRDEGENRPDLITLPLREAFVEALLRWSMDESTKILLPREYHRYFQVAAAILRRLAQEAALVEDSAETALRLYLLASRVPNRYASAIAGEEWVTVDLAGIQDMDGDKSMQDLLGSGVSSASGIAALLSDSQEPLGEEVVYHRIGEVESRGDFKPELVQVLMRLKENGQPDPKNTIVAPLSPEELQALLAKLGETEITGVMQGEVDSSSGMFITNLMQEAGAQASAGMAQAAPGKREKQEMDGDSLKATDPGSYLYDEWDFRANDYKSDWCLLREKTVEQGSEQYFDDTLKKYTKLASEVRKQFELLRPEMFKKIKKLTDGEDFDLDDVIEAAVERRAGKTPSDKLYWRRNKEERSVAMAFLLDMSASTDEDIVKEREPDEDIDWDDPMAYMIYLRERMKHGKKKRRRIIDIEKESTVLLIHALETVGDTYGVYGFSGYGRDDVEFFVIKDMEESLTSAVKSRIDRIEPVKGTRMGAAIRHTISKLDSVDARIKVLILLSDGRPQDHNYGRDRTEKDYAIRDTHMALVEAKRKKIVPFCLTVDQEGHDYLISMCDDMGYEVVPQIQSLPSRLPTLYRMLTM